MYSFSKMKSLNEVYNRLKSVSLTESGFDTDKQMMDLKKLFDKYQHTKLSRDGQQNLTLTVNGSYDAGEETVGVVLVFTPGTDGTFNVTEKEQYTSPKTRNGLSLDKIKQLYGGPGGLIGESVSYARYSNDTLTEIHMATKDVPYEIQQWVERKIGKVKRYEVIQKGSLHISPPWHERTYNAYGTFKMVNGRFILLSEFGMSGNDPNDLSGGSQVIEIPTGHVVVQTDSYTGTAKIYTSDDALLALPSGDTDTLTDAEKLALYSAKTLKSAYRHKFKQEVYDSLIAKGLLEKNKSISINGRNALEQIPKDELRRAAEAFNKANYANIYVY